jgi:hypothetical protein
VRRLLDGRAAPLRVTVALPILQFSGSRLPFRLPFGPRLCRSRLRMFDCLPDLKIFPVAYLVPLRKISTHSRDI